MGSAIGIKTIKQGNTGTLYKVGVLGNPDLSVGGPDYTCDIAVPGTAIARAVTTLLDNNTRFAVQLTPAETQPLTPGTKYRIAIEVNNTTLTPPFRVETDVEFYIEEQDI